ncbi:MAG: glycosyltransferase, partial [Nitrososphaerota archaeon]|nr:glycosyltransferase [Nitrososphaerota archaeon]
LGGRFPSKLLEYMTSGRPIVATDVDESWPVRESGAGIISPIDPKIFAEKIIQLLEDNKLAEELAEKGVRYARRFSWDDMVRKYLKLFIEILNERR